MLLVGHASNGAEAIEEFRRHQPDITLMDLRLPGINGTDTLLAIRGEFPEARIIVLTTSDADGEIQRVLRSGASGYMLKSMPKNELLAVIRAVRAGSWHVPAVVAARDARRTPRSPMRWRFPSAPRLRGVEHSNILFISVCPTKRPSPLPMATVSDRKS
jgi:DNA-binding NarL/FixJ family response regulator